MMEREKVFVKALSQHRGVCTDLFGLIKDEEKARIRRWEDERPSLELLLGSLNQSCDILKKEKKRLASELSARQPSVSSSTSQGAKPGQKVPPSQSSSQHGTKDPAALQRELDELNSRVQATDIEISIANEELATCERSAEREYLSTKCVVLQDTRRILAEEMRALRSDLARLDASSRVEAERRRAEESGWADVARLEEQLERTTSRRDRVKQQIYFPEAKGYRFSSGNGGIYVGARDLHLSEVSGRFEFTCEPTRRPRHQRHQPQPPQAQQQPQQQQQPAGGAAPGVPGPQIPAHKVARLTVVLGGVSASTALAERADSRRSGFQGSNAGGGSAAGDPPGRSSFMKHSRSSGGNLAASGGGSLGSGASGLGVSGGGAGGSSKSLGGLSGGGAPGPGAVAEGVGSPGGPADPTLLSGQPPQHQPSLPQGHAGSLGLPGASPQSSPADSPALPQPAAAATGTGPGPGPGSAAVGSPPVDLRVKAGAGGATADVNASVPSTPIHRQPNSPPQPGALAAAAGGGAGPLPSGGRWSPAAGPPQQQQAQQPPHGQQQQLVHALSAQNHTLAPQHFYPQQQQQQQGQGQAQQQQGHPLRPQPHGPPVPLRPMSSGPPAASGAPPHSLDPPSLAAAAQHRRAPSYDVAQFPHGAGAAAGGGLRSAPPPPRQPQQPMPYGLPTAMAAQPPRAKGEAVANFLSGLKNKKEKLKNMVGGLVGDRERQQGGAAGGGSFGGGGSGQQQGGMAYESMYGGDVAGSPSGGGRPRTQQMMEKLQDGLSEGKDKLSRIGKAIAAKAPEAIRDMKTKIRPGGRAGSGGGAADADWEDGLPSVGHPGSTAGAPPPGRYSPLQQGLHPPVPAPAQQPGASLLSELDIDYFSSREAGSGPGPGPVAAALQPPAQGQAQAGGGGLTEGRDGPGGGGGTGEAEAAAAATGATPDDSDGDSVPLGGFVEDFECRPSRKGVYVQLLGERVELLGERGTKVPDMSIREIMLEVEVAVTAVFEYYATGGGSGGGGAWLAPEPVSFNILQLEHRMRGNNIPLPKTLLKGLLNAYMPGVLTRLLAGLLPAELGAYTAASGETQALSGEFKVAGPSMSTTVTSIAPAPKPPSDPAKRAKWAAAQAAASRARAMLGLSDGQAAALAELFGGCGRPSLVPDSAGFSPSISGLCRFYVSYNQSGLWQPLLGVMDRALQAAFDFHGVRPAERFPLASFFDGPVARLVRKPLRIAFSIERLSLALDCDAALATVRDFFERLAREFEAKGPNRGADSDATGPPREPLEVQLELLDLWHASLARLLRTFKQRFRSGGATLLASADRRVFQFGAESVSYDGPLKLKFPLDLAMDPDGSFLIDVKLPDREEATHSITSLLTEVMYSLSTTVGGAGAGAAAAAAAAAAAPPGANTAFAAVQQAPGPAAAVAAPPGPAAPGSGPPSHASTLQAVVARAAAVQGALVGASSGGASSGGSPAGTSDGGGGSGGGGFPDSPASRGLPPSVAAAAAPSALYDIGHEWVAALAAGMPEGSALAAGTAPLLQNPVVGQLCVKKLALSLRLDEERIVELLAGARATAPAAAAHPHSHPHSHPHPHANPRHPHGPANGAIDVGAGGTVGSHPAAVPAAAATTATTVAAATTAPGGTAGADIAGRLLGCYGDLFTASLDTGWRAESDADSAAQKPCCMLTVASNDITRLRAEVEGLWFQSSVSPRLAVRVLQAVVIALVLKFHSADSYSIRFWNRAFNQLHEYLSKGSLDIAVCLSARATMDRPTDRLRVELSGQDLNAAGPAGGGGLGAGAGAGAGGGGAQGLLGRVCPVYLLNDINLMTVLDTMKLLSETAPAPPQKQQ